MSVSIVETTIIPETQFSMSAALDAIRRHKIKQQQDAAKLKRMKELESQLKKIGNQREVDINFLRVLRRYDWMEVSRSHNGMCDREEDHLTLKSEVFRKVRDIFNELASMDVGYGIEMRETSYIVRLT